MKRTFKREHLEREHETSHSNENEISIYNMKKHLTVEHLNCYELPSNGGGSHRINGINWQRNLRPRI